MNEAQGIESEIMGYTFCGMDFCDRSEEEARLEQMRREEWREQAIAWLREQRAIYIEKRRCPNIIQGFSTYSAQGRGGGQYER